MKTCAICGQVIEDGEEFVTLKDGNYACSSCCDDGSVFYCDYCGEYEYSENEYTVKVGRGDYRSACQECIDNSSNIRRCEECEEYVELGYARYDEYFCVCDECWDNGNWYICERCGYLVRDNYAHWDEDDYPYCQDCWDNMDHGIHEYSYKPYPDFYGSEKECFPSPLYMGVELEVDDGDDRQDSASNVTFISDDKVYCKSDGSLDDGYEIVSQPMTLPYHKSIMPWEGIMKQALKDGFRSHDTDTCGLHVHVSREALGTSLDTQDKVVANIVYIVENFWNEFVKFSRRTQSQLNQWAKSYLAKSNSVEETDKKVKGSAFGRYFAVNLQNTDTVEFRMFRGTLRYETFIATLEMVHHICKVAYCLAPEQIESLTWAEFCSSILEEDKELITYLKKMRLYINKSFKEEEEDI